MSRPDGYKIFDKKLYNGHKGLEDYVVRVLSTSLQVGGLELYKNPDPYGIDILVGNGKEPVGSIEVEWHGRYWRRRDFPFRTVHFLGRKKKYMTEGAFYLMTNNDGTDAVMIGFGELQHHGTRIMDNELCINEPIWDVPNDRCVWGWRGIIEALVSQLGIGRRAPVMTARDLTVQDFM